MRAIVDCSVATSEEDQVMQHSFALESAAGNHWSSTILKNHRFAALIFSVMFGIACVGQSVLLASTRETQSGGITLWSLPLLIALLAGFEWSQSRRYTKHYDSAATSPADIQRTILWWTVGMESIATMAGYLLIGRLIGWPTALGGPPLVAAVVIPMVSILRLDYRICLMQGVLGAVGYWLMVIVATEHAEAEIVSAGLILQVGKGVILLGTGAIAAVIAHQSRRRLLEVIREEKKREKVQNKLRSRTADYHRAEDIILEKNELISILSHDMRAPLDGVASLAQLMARAPERFTLADVRKYAEEIRSTAHNLRELLDNLVVWAELKSDQPSPPSASLSLIDLVDPVIQIFEPAIIARPLTIESKLSQNVLVMGDAAAIGTVIRNLVSNAVKYSPAHGRIRLSTIESPDAEQVALTVIDEGPGLAPEQLRSIANPEGDASSMKASGSVSTRPELGLALCRQLLRQLDGSLELLSADGGGTEARMWLPRS